MYSDMKKEPTLLSAPFYTAIARFVSSFSRPESTFILCAASHLCISSLHTFSTVHNHITNIVNAGQYVTIASTISSAKINQIMYFIIFPIDTPEMAEATNRSMP